MSESYAADLVSKLRPLLMPHQHAKREEARREGRKLVHYTTSDTALKILHSKRIWMRSIYAMNDFMETEHGRTLILDYFSENRERIRGLMNACHEEAFEEMATLYDGHTDNMRYSTFISCLSEHFPKENQIGRLSMWRAYGGNTAGAAIVINAEPFFSESPVGLISNPVCYFDRNRFFGELNLVFENINREIDMFRSYPRDLLINAVFSVLLNLTVCTKHPGFEEEQEWRIMFLPKIWSSPLVETETVTLGGIPQIVSKIILEDRDEFPIKGISASALLDHIIIGPSRFPLLQFNAFIEQLRSMGIEDAEKRISFSNIPLRT